MATVDSGDQGGSSSGGPGVQALTVDPDFFADVKFFVSGSLAESVEHLLVSGGALKKTYLSEAVTLCIGGDEFDENELQEAFDLYDVPGVRPEWVTESVRCKTRLPASCFGAVEPNQIFSGLKICCSLLTKKDVTTLWTLVVSRGGRFDVELKRDTTHLIVGCRDPAGSKKYEAAVTRQSRITIVTPDWVTESLKNGLLLSADDYHPRLLLNPGEVFVAKKKKKKKKPFIVVAAATAPIQPSTITTTPVLPTVGHQNRLLLQQLQMSDPAAIKTPTTGAMEQSNVAMVTSTTTPVTPVSFAAAATVVTASTNVTPIDVPPTGVKASPPAPATTPNATSNQAAVTTSNVSTVRLPQTPTTTPGPESSGPPLNHQEQLFQQQQQQQGSVMGPGHQLQQSHQVMQQQQGQSPQQMMGNQSPMPLQLGQQAQQWPQGQRPQWVQQVEGQQYQQQWQQQQQQRPMMAGQMVIQRPAQRPPTPHMIRQQQIIQQHVASLSMEDRTKFNQMIPREKQQYLAQRGLLLPNPQGQVLQRQTIALTDQQREMLQNMDPQQRAGYIQKLQKDAQMRQQMIQQRQQQPNAPGLAQMGPVPMQQQQDPQQQWQQQQQQPQQQSPQQQQQQFIEQGIRVPLNGGHQQVGAAMPNMGIQARMPLRMGQPPGMRPQWTGEAHPALAQVPHTPQQLQHLHRLQQQREQQQMDQMPLQQPRPPGAMPMSQTSPQLQPSGLTPPPSIPQGFVQPGAQQMMAQQQQQNGPNTQKTKAALQNMLNNRLSQPSPVIPMSPQQPQPQPAPPNLVRQMPSSPMEVGPPHMAMVTDNTGRLQMMPHQQSPPGHMMGSPLAPPSHMYSRPVTPTPPSPAQAYMTSMSPQRRPLDAMGQMTHPQIAPTVVSPHSMGAPRFGPRMGIPPGAIRPPMATVPRIQFYGHDPTTKLPPDLCLLGCIFFICDYQDDAENAKFVPSWKRVIRQFGGEVEDAYQPRITHLMCKSQDSSVSSQALREGKRLVTIYWLNDIVAHRKVLPPWKAIHFPLPANFDRPCENLILTLTGFEGRDRDWVKVMITMAGAKFTPYFTKHNHALVCKSPDGEKFAKAKVWKVPTVSVHWLNDVLFSNVNAVQCMNNPKYLSFRPDDPLRVDYSLVQSLMLAWKTPIRVTPETYQKVKSNLPTRLKRKAEKQRLEREEDAKRMRESDDPRGIPNAENPFTDNNNFNASTMTTLTDGHLKESSNLPPNQNGIVQSGANGGEQTTVPQIPGLAKPEMDKKSGGPRVLLTGFVSSELAEAKTLCSELGVEVTGQARSATHVVMPSLNRTIALLCAISHARFVLTIDWLKDSRKESKLKDELGYRLQDKEFETKFKCSLLKTLKNPDRQKLFEGRIFYLTPSIAPPWQKLISVIEHAGGKVDNRRRKSVNEINELNRPGQDPIYLIVTCEHDLHIVADVLKAKIGVYNAEFIMSAVLRGRINFDLTESLTTI